MKMIQVSEDALNSIKAMAEQDAKDAAKYRAWKPWIESALEDSLDIYEADDFAIVKRAMQTK